jgi:hypothetical protein
MRTAFLMAGAAFALLLALPAEAQTRAPRPAQVLALGGEASGELSPIDNQRASGKYEDVYLIRGRRGERVDLRLNADDFDPYLLVTGPGGFQLSNDDDRRGDTLHSRLVFELPADGEYRVSATSFAPGAMGAYRLLAARAGGGDELDRMQAAAPIARNAALSGRLHEGDLRLGGSKFQDRYLLAGRRGQRIRIGLESDDFDTFLMLEGPDGTTITSDDITENGRTSTNSRLDTVLVEDGNYVVTVTSYADGATGKYDLSVGPSPGNPRHVNVRAGQRVLAVAVGISDYERMSDLNYTDDDATELLASLRRAGMLHPQSVSLTNAQATAANVQAALRRAASIAGPDDVVMFFYSGHGDQQDTERSAAELDGRRETIELYDRAMTDAELQPLIDAIDGRMVVVAIDACFAGGFRNLVSRPNVLGLFSSEEDLTSLVASRLEAGGYLSYYLRHGLSGEADGDGDRIITSGELTTYLRRRFRTEGDIPASTREDENNYQYLIVERGGIHIDDGVVRLGADEGRASAEPAVRRAVMSASVEPVDADLEEPEGEKGPGAPPRLK